MAFKYDPRAPEFKPSSGASSFPPQPFHQPIAPQYPIGFPPLWMQMNMPYLDPIFNDFMPPFAYPLPFAYSPYYTPPIISQEVQYQLPAYFSPFPVFPPPSPQSTTLPIKSELPTPSPSFPPPRSDSPRLEPSIQSAPTRQRVNLIPRTMPLPRLESIYTLRSSSPPLQARRLRMPDPRNTSTRSPSPPLARSITPFFLAEDVAQFRIDGTMPARHNTNRAPTPPRSPSPASEHFMRLADILARLRLSRGTERKPTVDPIPPSACSICQDELASVSSGEETGGEHFAKIVCPHSFCSTCFQAWIAAKVEEQSHRIKCPAPDCTFILYTDDIVRIATPEVSSRFKELASQDFKSRLNESETAELLKAGAVACPDCKVLMIRSTGCDQMQCTCGAEFCYRCKQLYVETPDGRSVCGCELKQAGLDISAPFTCLICTLVNTRQGHHCEACGAPRYSIEQIQLDDDDDDEVSVVGGEIQEMPTDLLNLDYFNHAREFELDDINDGFDYHDYS